MGIPTGTTAILYDPGAASWGVRKWAIYLRQLQKTELANFITPTTLKVRDPALIANAPVVRSVKARVRRRYPGGPAISVPAGNRTVVVGPSIRLGTWPGRPITLERPKAGGDYKPSDADVDMKVLQLTLEGSFSDFYIEMQKLAKLDFILRTNNGRPIFVGSPTPPT
jgi:hypothetical protein